MTKPVFNISLLTLVLLFGSISQCCMPLMAGPMDDCAGLADCCMIDAATTENETAVFVPRTTPIQFDDATLLTLSVFEVSANDIVPTHFAPTAPPVPLQTGVLRI